MKIAIDFDGTVTTHEFPQVGKDVCAIPVLKALQKDHELILLTMRDNNTGKTVSSNDPNIKAVEGNFLDDAVNWFEDNGIFLWDINNNRSQDSWTTSRKVYADLYIDDMALGVPLLYIETYSNRPFVNWLEVAKKLCSMGLLLNFNVNSFETHEWNDFLIKALK